MQFLVREMGVCPPNSFIERVRRAAEERHVHGADAMGRGSDKRSDRLEDRGHADAVLGASAGSLALGEGRGAMGADQDEGGSVACGASEGHEEVSRDAARRGAHLLEAS